MRNTGKILLTSATTIAAITGGAIIWHRWNQFPAVIGFSYLQPYNSEHTYYIFLGKDNGKLYFARQNCIDPSKPDIRLLTRNSLLSLDSFFQQLRKASPEAEVYNFINQTADELAEKNADPKEVEKLRELTRGLKMLENKINSDGGRVLQKDGLNLGILYAKNGELYCFKSNTAIDPAIKTLVKITPMKLEDFLKFANENFNTKSLDDFYDSVIQDMKARNFPQDVLQKVTAAKEKLMSADFQIPHSDLPGKRILPAQGVLMGAFLALGQRDRSRAA